MKDPYQALGVSRSASEAEIKSAYRKMAKNYHPDSNAGDTRAEAKFAEVNNAYELLKDKEKRAQFDAGQIDADGNPKFAGFDFNQARRGGAQQGNPFGGAGGFNPEDIFSEIFGGFKGGNTDQRTRRSSPPPKGEDMVYRMKIDFLSAAKGDTRRITLPDGKKLDVKIPAGVETGKQIRLKGQGKTGAAGSKPGDALIKVEVEDHDYFVRDGSDIRLEMPITLYEAVLGAKIRVPTLEGTVEMKIPANSNSGKILRLKGKGIAKSKSSSGDLLISLRIMLPESSDGELKKMMKSWEETNPYDPRGKFFGNNS